MSLLFQYFCEQAYLHQTLAFQVPAAGIVSLPKVAETVLTALALVEIQGYFPVI